MPAGQPPKFKSPEELEEKITAYFANCEENDKPYTMSGLAVFLGVDRQTILNYSHKDEFFGTIKRAREKVEAFAEESLYRNGQVTGVIFNLKNNFGWKDTQNVEQRYVDEDGKDLHTQDKSILEKLGIK